MGGFRPPLQSDPGGSLAVHFSGLSLSFHFGRDARNDMQLREWGRITRFVGTILS